MKIWVTRHGQTNLNKQSLMQGLTDEPLNETGILQARKTKNLIGDVKFDAVFASPLDRALTTASVISGLDKENINVDKRIIEMDFGKYELAPYRHMGFKMTIFFLLPEIFKAPKTVEPIPVMANRVESFFKDLEAKDYENVLIVCHGGIIRVICGYLEEKRNKIKWRPKPQNCEVRVYDFDKATGKHTFVKRMLP